MPAIVKLMLKLTRGIQRVNVYTIIPARKMPNSATGYCNKLGSSTQRDRLSSAPTLVANKRQRATAFFQLAEGHYLPHIHKAG